ncbi:MAG: hypothetical protein WCG80_16670 [Spirochaetales bacterium]
MKTLAELRREQAAYCVGLTEAASAFARDLAALPEVEAVLLTGSVARGDARQAPLGLLVDVLVLSASGAVPLEPMFGANTEPELPFYCPAVRGTGFAVAQESLERFAGPKSESESFALAEAKVLFDRSDKVGIRLGADFPARQAPRQKVAMEHYGLYQYLGGPYRWEKWDYREAWTQLAQNAHEAFESFCAFAYARNGSFVPRKDWLVYLLTEQPNVPADLASLVDCALRVTPDQAGHAAWQTVYLELDTWMKHEAAALGWL